MIEDELRKKLLEDNFVDILGQESTKVQLKSALLAGRHIIIAGPPGVGKTTLAKNVAKLLPEIKVNDCKYNCLPANPLCPECISKKMLSKIIKGEERFVRIQGSPDLTSEDLLGDIDPIKALKFGPSSQEAFTPGKVFLANNGILFFDEINRCPEKLQNALLQVLEEKKATIGSYKVDISADFIFIGTMNPKDTSTEKLSEVFLDRFDIVYMGYPEETGIEEQIVLKKGKKITAFPEELLQLTVEFVRQLRESKKVSKFPSVRATLGLYERAQTTALLRNHAQVQLEDIKDSLISVLAHRIELKPSVKYAMSAEQFIQEEAELFEKKGGYR